MTTDSIRFVSSVVRLPCTLLGASKSDLVVAAILIMVIDFTYGTKISIFGPLIYPDLAPQISITLFGEYYENCQVNRFIYHEHALLFTVSEPRFANRQLFRGKLHN